MLKSYKKLREENEHRKEIIEGLNCHMKFVMRTYEKFMDEYEEKIQDLEEQLKKYKAVSEKTVDNNKTVDELLFVIKSFNDGADLSLCFGMGGCDISRPTARIIIDLINSFLDKGAN